MKHPAYNLRPNKAVDRSLLVERIRELESVGLLCTRDSSYYGFGGPFLDDLRMLSESFPYMSIHSLERNIQTYKRQNFHKFSPSLKLYRGTVNDFLANESMASSSHLVWWLDFTGFGVDELRDVTSIVNSLSPGDFLRVTANADVDYDLDRLADLFGSDKCDEAGRNLIEKFRVSYEEYLTDDCSVKAILDDTVYPDLCVKLIENALEKRDNAAATRIWHLGNRIYRDGVQMVTCEFYITKKKYEGATKGLRYLNQKQKLSTESVNVPNLSIKERLLLEAGLTKDSGRISRLSKKLGYKVEKTKNKHESAMLQYSKYNKHYPMLGKVAQ